MRMRFCCLLVSAVSIICFIKSLNLPSSIKAEAAGLPSGGRFMTEQETITLFGSTINVTYMDTAGVYHSVAAYYTQSPVQVGIANQWNDTTGYTISGRNFLPYQFETEGSLNGEPRNITVDVSCQYSIFDTEYIYTCAAIPCSTTTNISAYNSPSWDWIWAGSQVQFSPSDLAVNNVLPQIYFSDWCDFVPAYMDSQATTSGYSLRITFDHASLYSGRYGRIYIGLPYVSDGASGYNGTSGLTTSGSETTSTQINVNVDVDMSETNGILGTISSSISNLASNIISGITSIFIPSQEDFQRFRSTIDTKLEENFGVAYTAHTIIHDTIAGVDTTQIEETIDIPQIQIPVVVNSSGETLQAMPFGGWTVSLKPESSKLSFLYSSLRLIGNIIVTLAVINTLRNKFEYFINGGKTVVIEDE